MTDWLSASAIASGTRAGKIKATDTVAESLARITNSAGLNAVTDMLAERALARAAAVDAGTVAGPLAGVPFAVKNLFDVAGLPTRAGSKINRGHSPAMTDAVLVQRMEAAGAILIAALNMGEYAYDFTGENCHDGNCRNPHDPTRMSGGSSSGSGAAVAAGLVPIALGSDTNGSIRVPASLCGVFGLKPTYGRLPRAGTFPFVASLDHLGPLARSVADLALAYDAMQGWDPADPVCVDRPAEPAAGAGTDIQGLRIAVAGGHFAVNSGPDALAAVQTVAKALETDRVVDLPQAGRARAAAYVITATEGAALHLDRLRSRADDFDPDVRDRLIAGALMPGAFVVRAQKFRRWFRDQVLALFDGVDAVLIAATPCTAPLIGQKTMLLAGAEVPVRPSMGVLTQPISFIGLPVVAVPVPGMAMPIGVQIVTAPWREDIAFRIASHLEAAGTVRAPRPQETAAWK